MNGKSETDGTLNAIKLVQPQAPLEIYVYFQPCLDKIRVTPRPAGRDAIERRKIQRLD